MKLLAGPKDADVHVRRRYRRRPGEGLGGLGEESGVGAAMERAVGAPVDRDRDPRRQPTNGLRRPLGVEVLAAPERCAPAPDGDERHVEVLDQAFHPVEEIGVACEEDPRGAEDRVSERGAFAERRASTGVLGVRGEDPDRADRQLRSLVDARDIETRQLRYQRPWSDDPRGLSEHSQRREVEMVVVAVRDEHGVDLRHWALQSSGAPQVSHPVPQQRVRDKAHAVELDQHCGVPDVANHQ